jgi:RNA polymerase sigma factor (sigma-70 family)
MSPEEARLLLVENLSLVAEVARICGRRDHLTEDQVEDLRSHLQLHLLADDCAVLRSFGGRSSLKTFLVTVMHRLVLDWRTAERGRWRPSALAQRLGKDAVELERLIGIDHLEPTLALRVLASRSGPAAAAAIEQAYEEAARHDPAAVPWLRAPARGQPAALGDLACDPPASEPAPDELLLAQEAQRDRRALLDHLEAALGELEPRDQLLVRWRFAHGMKIADIARLLGEPARPLYQRFERLFGELRRRLEAAGATAAQVAQALSASELPLEAETEAARTSKWGERDPATAARHPGADRRQNP